MPAAAAAPAAIARRESLEARLRERPTDPGLLADLGSFLAEVGLYDEALVQLHKALEFAPGRRDVLRHLAEAYAATGDNSAAAKQWRALLAVEPEDVAAHVALARLRLADGDQQGGAGLLAEASRLAPHDTAILRQRKTVLRQLGPDRADELAAVSHELTVLDATDIEAWETVAAHHLTRGDTASALTAFASLRKERPDHPRACLYAGVAALEGARARGADETQAVQLLEKALVGQGLSDEELDEARLRWCEAGLRAGADASSLARRLSDVAVDRLPPDRQILHTGCALGVGVALARAGDPVSAIPWLRRAHGHGGGTEARAALAQAYLERGRQLVSARGRGAAIRNFRAGLEDLPGEPALVEELAALRGAARRRLSIAAAAAVLVALMVAGLLYFSSGTLEVRAPVGTQVAAASPAGSSVRWSVGADGTHRARVTPGSYVIRTAAPRCIAWDSAVVVSGGRATRIVPPLRRGYAHWSIYSTPRAELIINGRNVGMTPRDIPRFPMGPHDLRLVVPGLPPLELAVFVVPDRDTTLRLRLRLPVVTARISNVDDEAALYVNGREVIRTGWGRGPAGTRIGHAPGYTGWVDISRSCHPGANPLRFWVWNASVCCGVSGTFEVRLDGNVVVRREFAEQSSTEGTKFDEAAVLNIGGTSTDGSVVAAP